MEDFGKWTDQDLENAHKLFSLAIKAGDRGAAEYMRNGVAGVIEARFLAESGPEIGLAQIGGTGPFMIMASMDVAFEQAFGV